ncbi:MAG TPA: PhoX family phosphatase, partial [Kofleriaceae bacterium]|nr:PhoX family phosphatase [Kofleriaceae bacterium]
DRRVPLPAGRPAKLGFAAVDKSLADAVTVPAGYTASVLYATGDPLAAEITDYANDGSDDAASFARRSGDHHDGMSFFGLGEDDAPDAAVSERGLLCVNHESVSTLFVHANGATVSGGVRTVAEEVWRELYLHGVSVVELRRDARGQWRLRRDSPYNRRIHAASELELSGPLRGAAAMVTQFSPDGTRTRGTVHNCSNGVTPWGTYLTCEENWAGQFRRLPVADNALRTAKEVTALARYGVSGPGRHFWATVTPDTDDQMFGRWNAMVRGASAAEDYRNVANTFGWVVELDPYTPSSVARKRTAMGRLAREGAVAAKAEAGRPVVFYSGDDTRNEYIYKYVSAAPWDPADALRGDRLAVGDKYLDAGTVYAAKFHPDGTGTWLPLGFGEPGISPDNAAYPFADAADVALHTRLAADAAGATKMDRPEWAAVDPLTGAVYVTLTNADPLARPLTATDAANPRHYNHPRTDGEVTTAQWGNPNGHIIRWLEPSPEATTFSWDIFLFGAGQGDPPAVNMSGLSQDNDFSSPDGLWFSARTSICWIETDDGAATDVSNCMLLAALPGSVGDGERTTVHNTDERGQARAVRTRIGARPGARLRRFLVGPVGCELTGLTESPDGCALFVNIQHPGEGTVELSAPRSTWPSSQPGARPRSATIVITRDDGGRIGL